MESPLPAETITLPARGWRIDRTHALIAATVCWVGFALIAWLVHSGRVTGFDEAGLRLFRRGPDQRLAGSAGILEAVRDVTALGGWTLRWLFSIVAVAALLFLRLRREAVLLTITLLSGLLVEQALKVLVGRPRPQIVRHLTEAGGMSFPSGHSYNSALGFLAVALAFATLSNRRSVRWTLIGGAMVLALFVAWSRVLLGVHFPSDVIAGWLGGTGWAFLAAPLFHQPAKAINASLPDAADA